MNITFFPYPELFIYSYLTKAGFIPYKQIFDQHFPGLMFLPVNLATLGMDTPSDARFWHLGSIILSQVLIFLIGKKLFRNNNALVILGNFLFLLWQPFFEGYVLWIETFVTPILLTSFYFLLMKHRYSFFYSGFFLGLALLFKQVLIPLIVVVTLYLFFVTKEKKHFFAFVFGAMIPVLFLAVWISKFGIGREFFYWTVIFNLTTFSEMGRKYPDISSLVRSLPLFGLSILSVLFSLAKMREQKKRNRTFELLIIFFVGTLVFAYARWDYIHLQPVLPFALFLILFALQKINFKILKLGLLVYFLGSLSVLLPFYKNNFRKGILFHGETEKKISQEVLKYSKQDETTFAFGTFPHLYQMTKTLPPGGFFAFQFPWFMVEAEDAIYEGIIIDPPKVVVRDENSEVQSLRLINFMPKISEYIDKYYRVVDKVDGTEIMIKN